MLPFDSPLALDFGGQDAEAAKYLLQWVAGILLQSSDHQQLLGHFTAIGKLDDFRGIRANG